MIEFTFKIQYRRLVYLCGMLIGMKSKTTTDTRQHILETAQDIIARKGFTSVGLNEILQVANVPKGSFYYYFPSKEKFGQALLENYFNNYLLALEVLEHSEDSLAAHRLLDYLEKWLDSQAINHSEGKCLAVKLAAEVSDLSEAMRDVLCRGTEQVVIRITNVMKEAIVEGSLPANTDAQEIATMLYHLWLGACLRAKVTRDRKPLDAALHTTRALFNNYNKG